MVSLNKVIVAGNLTRDPEVRFTPSGQPVGGLDLAINNYYLTKEGEKKNEPVFVHVVVWGKQAETAKTYLSKGSAIFVEGRLHLDNWETKEGEKRSRLKIVAQRIQFLDGAKNRNSAGGGVEQNITQDLPSESVLIEEDDVPF